MVVIEKKILSSLQTGLERGMGALNSFSTSIVTYAEASGETFPFVRVLKFAAQAAQTVLFSNGFQTFFVPVVKPELREKWENFTSSKNTTIWKIVNETEQFMSTYDQYYGPLPSEYNWSFFDKIYNDIEIDRIVPSNNSQPFYLPNLHAFPLAMVGYGPANFGTFTVYRFTKERKPRFQAYS
jgi:hypothetical protein